MRQLHWLVLPLLCLLSGCNKPATPVQAQAASLRVIAITPGLAELMYAAGAGDMLIATVEYADYPQAARLLPRVGDAFRVDMEKVLALKPDLILAGGSLTPRSIVQQLQVVGLHVEDVEAHSLQDIAGALRSIGQITQRQQLADSAATQFEADVAALRKRYATATRLSVFIEIANQPLYTVNYRHVISEAVSLCGGDNVFADLDQLAPVISIEAVLKRNPAVILGTDSSNEQLQAQWQHWPQLQAVQHGRVYVVPPDITARATPRMLQAITAICGQLETARSSFSSQIHRAT